MCVGRVGGDGACVGGVGGGVGEGWGVGVCVIGERVPGPWRGGRPSGGRVELQTGKHRRATSARRPCSVSPGGAQPLSVT